MPRPAHHRRAVLALVASTLVLAGCTGQDSEKATPTTSTPTTSAPAPSRVVGDDASADPQDQMVTLRRPAFSLDASSVHLRICLDERSAEQASADYTWRAEAPVTVTKVELIDPDGVRIVGPVLTVPPVNRGGAIPFGGRYTWGTQGRQLAKSRFVYWPGRERLDTTRLGAGDTGLVVLHLRHAEGRGSSHGLRVTYRIEDGSSSPGPFTAEATDDVRWDLARGRKPCRI